LHMHVHVRQHLRYRLGGFEPVIYPRVNGVHTYNSGANLRFKIPELGRRMNRIFGKGRVA
jgi:hypothetical protein